MTKRLRKAMALLVMICLLASCFTALCAGAEEKEETYRFTGTYISPDQQTVVHYLLHCYADHTLLLEYHSRLEGTWAEESEGLLTLRIGDAEYTAKKSATIGRYAFRYPDRIGTVDVKIRLETASDGSVGGTQTDEMLIQAYKSTVEDMARKAKGHTGEIVLYGGSNFVKWETAAQDLAGYPVLNHSFGGSNDVTRSHYMRQLVYDIQPSILITVNDTNNWTRGQTLEEVIAYRQLMLEDMRAQMPNTVILYLSNTPNPLRYYGEYHDQCVASDAWTKEWCDTHDGFEYLDIVPALSLEDGSAPNMDLWQDDSLHLNGKGYELLTRVLREELDSLCRKYGMAF